MNGKQIDNQKSVSVEGFMLKRVLTFTVNYLIPLGLTVAMVWYMFSKVDFREVVEIMRHGVVYGWILMAMILSVFSHILRALRWRMQFRTMGANPPLMALSCSIFGTYALNLVFPRLGELWRCTYVARRERMSFTAVFGSMVSDRLADSVMVLTLAVITFFTASGAVLSFLAKYPVGEGALDVASSPRFWIITLIIVVAIAALVWGTRHTALMHRISKASKDLWRGLMSVVHMRGKWMFVFLTVALWGCYFVQLYVAFYAFPFTRALCTDASLGYGLIPCLVAFVFSSVGMAVPSNGGLGPWNIAVMFGLAVYGVGEAEGTAFSVLVWSAQTVMLILLGIFTMIYISFDSKRRQVKSDNSLKNEFQQ